MNSTLRSVGLGVAAAVVIAAVLVVGYQAGWWLREDIVQRGGEVREDSYARQTALQTEILDLHDDATALDATLVAATGVQRQTLLAQREAVVDRLCDAAGRLLPSYELPTATAMFVGGEC